ncbi:MAG: ABC transporter ATP-binding protein [Rhodospirillales bacterium]
MDSAANVFTERVRRHRSTAALFKRLLRENVRPYAGWFAAAVACMVVVAAATAFSAQLMEPLVNRVLIAHDETMLWWVAGAIFATFFAKGAANFGQAMVMNYVGLRVVTDCQKRLFAHLAHMDTAFFNAAPTGALISRFTVDVGAMRAAVSNVITSLGKDLLSFIGLVILMFVQDWVLAVMSLLVFPAAVLPIVRLGRRMRKVVADTQHEMGLFTAILTQTFQGVRAVKAYGMEAYEKSRVNAVTERIFGLNLKAARTRALSSPVMEALGGFAVGAVVIIGGFRVINGQTDAGSLVSFATALLMAYEPMKRLANLNASLQEGMAGAQRYFDALDTQPDVQESPDAKPLRVTEGAVRLEGVTFAYNTGDDEGPRAALNGVDLDIPAGKAVALVGPSGAGKSTILNLIPRFYDAQTGRVLIDGQDVRGVTFASLYGAAALVSQEITLFDDTVRANIAYGRAGASDAEIIEAARGAAAHDFIMELPQGYDTAVGEQGLRLSGGQRQRLAIARAMLKNAPILLLDEATSALDTESERQVQAALARLMQGRTTLIIAHRLSTVARADLIYVIDKGRVAEQGRHEDLLKSSGLYARLYAMQFADDDSSNTRAGA